MNAAANNTHPRKLYELIRACPSAEARCKAAFQFLEACTGSTQAYLFLARGAHLALLESSPSVAEVPGLAEAAELSWRGDSQTGDDGTKTIDMATMEAMEQQSTAAALWHSPGGLAFDRRMLSLYRNDAWLSLGVFMFAPAALSAPKPIRAAHIAALCNALLDAGDVVPPEPSP